MKKRIPDKVYVQWYSTGTKNNVFPIGVDSHAKYTCLICGVNTGGEIYGCQGMRFDEWYELLKAQDVCEEEK